MLVETKAIVLHSIKYNDSSLIAHCYTETLGIQSFMLKGILSAKKGKIRKAHFQPLTLLNIQFQYKNKGGLNFIKELRVAIDTEFGKGEKSFSEAVMNENNIWYSDQKQINH
ncbi:MAG: recombination protein O N-terminal domain-containing protein, partial [Flavobacteriaceae bacterium]